ncbi:hypothetical protein D7Z54_20875 [Salibacterium salarium]|uniref:Uncharacterized protein n=1 Tax=Salibacterium salarium TaxID=284579 RepID=A0A428MZA9_9BACI|nr:hypothetical protein [Salibacterium salarium]RSL31491.1 hypothetical protein D7Z54_20875 [Salibacterium salarium]
MGKKDKQKSNMSNSEKRWRIVDAIFSNGFFGMFYDSETARKENDSKKFNQMMVGALIGVIISVIVFGPIIYFN